MRAEDGLYVLGCFERRVTLLSQQVRALNLVHSLRSQGLLAAGSSIAVIGGGVAGLTAAAGAARLGCEVTLLERGDAPLHLFRGNHTRWLHPHLYDWPKAEADSEDAGLPLLNWRAGLADDVVRQIQGGFDALPERDHIEVHTGVANIALGSGTPRRLTWNAPGLKAGKFALVILAVGFGLERQVVGIPRLSYWDNDSLHQASRTGATRYLISGTGDGGLIDLLRVRLRDFRHDQVLATLLASPALDPIKARLLDIEDEAVTEEHRRAGSSLDHLYEAYTKLEVPAEIDKAIEARLRTDGTTVVLNGLDALPYSLGASILNRFLVSRLLVRFGLAYRAGDFGKPKKKGDAFVVRFGGTAPATFDVIVTRRGPEAALETGFPGIWTKCVDAMRARSLLDQTRTPNYRTTFDLAPRSGPAPAGGSPSLATDDPPRQTKGRRARAKSAPRTPHNLRARNRDFRGRGDELAALDETLRNEKRTTITHASIFGLGGVGKTALALEYAHRAVERGEYPGGVWWVHAEGKPVDALGNLASTLRRHATAEVREGLAGDETRADQIADAVRLALQGQRARSLLVLDNVSEPGWASHLPAGEVRVLVTTRDESLALGSSRRLEVLSATQAREVADAIAGEARGEAETAAQQRVLVTELGGLAVAVEMAARAVKTWFRGSWIAYERVLREEMDRVLTDPKLVGEYGRGVFAAIDLSIDKCDTEARGLLEGAAVFAPDAAPLAWALKAAGLEVEGAVARATALVNELGLVTLDADAGVVSLHRLVHRQVRRRAETEHEDAWREASLRGAEAAEEWVSYAVTLYQSRTEMETVDARREHLDQALDAANRVDSQDAWITIANGLAIHLHNRARNDEALALVQQALAKAEQLVPPDLLSVAASLSNLATVLKALGDAASAKALLERAISLAEKSVGPEHPNVATCLSNLATVLQDLGDAAGAKPLLERALGIDETTFGPEHPSVAARLSNLATVLHALGDAAGAKPLLERALGINNKTFGPEHPRVATSLSILALVLKDLGDASGAKPLLERALGIDETTFGPEHPSVATRLSNLATVLHALGGADEAKPLLERALSIVETHLPPGHPQQRVIRGNLASLAPALLAPPARRKAARQRTR
jgi:tetratricopeptide (TPR) repeat protein